MLQLFTASVNQKLVNICYPSPPLGRKGGGWVVVRFWTESIFTHIK